MVVLVVAAFVLVVVSSYQFLLGYYCYCYCYCRFGLLFAVVDFATNLPLGVPLRSTLSFETERESTVHKWLQE